MALFSSAPGCVLTLGTKAGAGARLVRAPAGCRASGSHFMLRRGSSSSAAALPPRPRRSPRQAGALQCQVRARLADALVRLAETGLPANARSAPQQAGAGAVEAEETSPSSWARVDENGAVHSGYSLWSRVHARSERSSPATLSAWSGAAPADRVLFSDVLASPKQGGFLNRTWTRNDFGYLFFMVAIHAACLLAPLTYSPSMVALFFVSYLVTGCVGITFSFHRQLSHKSFKLPKVLEYAAAYAGCMAVQGDPIEWVSSHRHHHTFCDTPKDPHTPYEGFWWSHMGWLLDNDATLARVGDRSNASDMASQPFYQFMASTYAWHVIASAVAFYAIGGLPAFVWGFCLRTVWVYHITWFVNSASHVWGSQPYATGDLSRNLWWVGILAFGEGWHNNHHAFEFSARHGLEWWQVDFTWYLIRALQAVGLATKVKLPSEAQKARLAVA